MSDIAQNLAGVRGRIVAACARAGRSADSVRLVAVSKTFGAADIDEAVRAGVTDIGENRVQEFRDKAALLATKPRRHLIGPLQSNKVNEAARLFDVVQSVDRPELVEKLNRAALRENKQLEVLVQVNLADEPQKSGCSVAETPALLQSVLASENLKLLGLMTIPPLGEAEEMRRYFSALRTMRDEAKAIEPSISELSMGMSADFEVAIEEGATMIRVGRAIFGARDSR